jgi:hypothetical protein
MEESKIGFLSIMYGTPPFSKTYLLRYRLKEIWWKLFELRFFQWDVGKIVNTSQYMFYSKW